MYLKYSNLLVMKRIAFFIVSIFCMTACSNESDTDNVMTEPRIELLMPDAEMVHVYSTASPNECKIDVIWVIEFNGSTGALVNSELINGADIVVNSQNQAAQLLPQLKFKPTTNNKIVCIANVSSGTLPGGITFSNYKTLFPLLTPFCSGGTTLPMHGVMDWTGTSYTCQMVRAMAKIQVQMGTNVSDNTANFSAENVVFGIYNYAKSGFLGADGTAQPAATQNFTDPFWLLQKKNATENQISAYIHAYPSATKTSYGTTIASNKLFNKDRQCVILTKENSSSYTFYRLDFYRSSDSSFLDIKANHHYLFTINKVYSEGYSSVTEAINNPSSNIEYTVRIEDSMNKVTSNGQYAIATNIDTAYVSASATNRPIAHIRYEDPSGQMQASVNSLLVSEATPAGSLTLVSPTQISASNVDIVVTTNASFQKGVILCKLGNVEHKLIVMKE